MDLGKANKLVVCLKESFQDVRISSLVDMYKTATDEVCKECNIAVRSPHQGRKRRKQLPKHLEDYWPTERTGDRSIKTKK